MQPIRLTASVRMIAFQWPVYLCHRRFFPTRAFFKETTTPPSPPPPQILKSIRTHTVDRPMAGKEGKTSP